MNGSRESQYNRSRLGKSYWIATFVRDEQVHWSLMSTSICTQSNAHILGFAHSNLKIPKKLAYIKRFKDNLNIVLKKKVASI